MNAGFFERYSQQDIDLINERTEFLYKAMTPLEKIGVTIFPIASHNESQHLAVNMIANEYGVKEDYIFYIFKIGERRKHFYMYHMLSPNKLKKTQKILADLYGHNFHWNGKYDNAMLFSMDGTFPGVKKDIIEYIIDGVIKKTGNKKPSIKITKNKDKKNKTGDHISSFIVEGSSKTATVKIDDINKMIRKSLIDFGFKEDKNGVDKLRPDRFLVKDTTYYFNLSDGLSMVIYDELMA